MSKEKNKLLMTEVKNTRHVDRGRSFTVLFQLQQQ